MLNDPQNIENDISMKKTANAFNRYRAKYGPPRSPDPSLMTHADDSIQLSPCDGLKLWVDGPVPPSTLPPDAPPLDFSLNMPDKHIWVVRTDDVVYALEQCDIAKCWDKGVVKHSNLTGGNDAFAGGELRFLQDDQIIINGASGRFNVRDDEEMRALGNAFLKSGYHVCCMGFDREAGVPYPLGSVASNWLG